MRICIDLETSYRERNGRNYPLPFNPENRIVTFQYEAHEEVGSPVFTSGCIVLNHKDLKDDKDNAEHYNKIASIQGCLNNADLLIGHNLKFDILWLKECGFEINCPLYDTMIGEYILSQGLKLDLSLAGSALRRGAEPKGDYVAELIKSKTPIEDSDLNKLCDYALNDVKTTWELYEAQIKAQIAYNIPVYKLMNEFLEVLIDMEAIGTHIDLKALEDIETAYRNEHRELKAKLEDSIRKVMGDTPVNIDSPEQLSQVIYSRKVNGKEEWRSIFNIGTELRNSVYKKKRLFNFGDNAFRLAIRDNTTKVYKTKAVVCTTCQSKGSFRKIKKDGTEFKKDTICKECFGKGYLYQPTDKVAGFKVTPINSSFVADGGFATGKKVIESLLSIPGIRDEAKEFLRDYARYSAISSYITSFIEGIKNNVWGSILHVNYNQCIASTGRLTSSNPNFQNLPRDKTFPIRQVITSRFAGGSILDCDLAQIEFRVAGILSGCGRVKSDILEGVDVHNFTKDVLTTAGQPTDRQDAKPHTFKPLFGGLSGTEAEVTYYKAFLTKYAGVADWHERLSEEAIAHKQIKSPSGRIYAFPHAKRMRSGKSSQYTQIVNYCVQGFAGDIAQAVMVEIYNRMKNQKVKSKLILTVHDSVTADIYPGEETLMIQLFKESFDNLPKILYNRFGISVDIPIGYELSIGPNWANKTKVK